jgi:hypothetical protein
MVLAVFRRLDFVAGEFDSPAGQAKSSLKTLKLVPIGHDISYPYNPCGYF